MKIFAKSRAPRWRRAAARLAAALAVAAPLALGSCSDDLLTVQDPDIIDPGNVESAAGADAVRLGTLRRLVAATSGGSSTADNIFLLGGLFADEWINGDSFIARQEIDQRVITRENSFLTGTNRALHRARLSAEQAVDLLARYNPGAPAWQVAEMHFVQAYVANLLAEHYCSGIVFSTVVSGEEQYGSPITTQAALERALKHADDGLALLPATLTTANDVRVRNALRVTRGRILMNLNRPAEAQAAVAAVPVEFRYRNLHSERTEINYTWQRNNVDRRYSVGNREGGNGLNFATANDPRLPVCVGGDTRCRAIGVTNRQRDDLGDSVRVQMLWPAKDSAVTIVSGVEARLIEAEAQLRAGAAPASLATLNALRANRTLRADTTIMPPLTAATTEAGSVDQLFRERAFWLFGRGHRVGDLRRLIRHYGRPAESVFPTGRWHKLDGTYGTDVTIPIPSVEQNNPNVQGDICLNRNA